MALPATTIYMTMNGAQLVFGPTLISVTPPSYTGGDNVSCQIVDANIPSSTVTETTSPTLCNPDPVESIVGITDSLVLTAYQDWTDPAGLCWYLRTNRLDRVFFSLAFPEGGSITGETTLAPIQFGGPAGSNLQGSVTLPVFDAVDTPPTVGTQQAQAKSRLKARAASKSAA